MTLRNIGIVFSPTLGIPAGILYELVSHFGAIFNDDADELVLDPALTGAGRPSPEANGAPAQDELTVAPNTTRRNSMLYLAAGADTMLGLSGRALDPAAEDSQSELSIDDFESEPALSAQSSENDVSLATTSPEQDPNNTARRRDLAAMQQEETLVHNGSV